MSNNTKITIKNAEGDPALIIGLSIFAYVDFDQVAKIIKESVDPKSASETKKNLIEAVMTAKHKFHVAKSYRKSIDIIADRDTDEHNTLTTKPISSQLKDITVLQKAIDDTITVDDIELSDASKTSDDLVRAMHAIMDKADGDIFEAYEKAKKQKGIKSDDDTDSEVADEKGKKTDETNKITDPFEVPIGDSEEGADKEKTGGKVKTDDTDKSDEKEEDNDDAKLAKIKDKNTAIKKALPFSKFSLDPNEEDEADFLKDNKGTKIVSITPDSVKKTKEESEQKGRKDLADKEDAIKAALPFSDFNLDKKELDEDKKKDKNKNVTDTEEVQIEQD